MASLQRIRNHGALLLIIVGVAMLAFIMGDFMNSGSSFFNRSRQYVGEIEGEDIHIQDYELQREQLTDVYKIESGRQDFDEDMQAQINNQVWQLYVLQHTLGKQAAKIGMTVTNEELSDLCQGQHVHQLISQRRLFQDENGQFSPELFQNFYNVVFSDDEDGQYKQWRNYWMYWEKAVRLTYIQEKYTDLLQNLVGANALDAKCNLLAEQTSVNVDYVQKSYFSVADSLVNVTNTEIKNLYNKRKEQLKQTPNRSLSYVAFDIVPSEQDYQDVEKWINKLKDEFANTEDVAGVVNGNSDILYNGQNYSEATIPAELKAWAFEKGRKAGDVTEVLFENDTYEMARMMQVGYQLPDSVELRGAVVADEKELDSLKAEWAKGNYGEVEAMWVTEAQVSKDIAEKAFSAKKNEWVTVEYGSALQAIQVVDKSVATPKVKVAILARTVIPSSKTYANIYNQAKQFAVSNNTETKFNDAAAEQNLTVQPAFNLQENANKVGELKQSRAIVRWAFGAKEGDVSDVFECGEQFIVATLTDVKDGKYRSLSDASAELRREIMQEKKAALIINDLKGISTLDEAAQKLGVGVQSAEGITLNSYRFGNAGQEPAVVGASVALEQGALSAPIEGNNGVYVVLCKAKTANDAEPAEDAIKQQIQQLGMRYQYSLPYQAINLIEEKAEIEDNRANFY